MTISITGDRWDYGDSLIGGVLIIVILAYFDFSAVRGRDGSWLRRWAVAGVLVLCIYVLVGRLMQDWAWARDAEDQRWFLAMVAAPMTGIWVGLRGLWLPTWLHRPSPIRHDVRSEGPDQEA